MYFLVYSPRGLKNKSEYLDRKLSPLAHGLLAGHSFLCALQLPGRNKTIRVIQAEISQFLKMHHLQ